MDRGQMSVAREDGGTLENAWMGLWAKQLCVEHCPGTLGWPGPHRVGLGVILHKVRQRPALFYFWRMRQMAQKHIPKKCQFCPAPWHVEEFYKEKLTHC